MFDRKDNFQLAQYVDKFVHTCTYLELLVVGLLPTMSTIGEWDWDPMDCYCEENEPNFLGDYSYLEVAKKASIIIGPDWAGLTLEVIIARLSFIAEMREKGGILPPDMVEDLKQEKVFWSPSNEETPPAMLRLLKAFGHEVLHAPTAEEMKGYPKAPSFGIAPRLGDVEYEGRCWTEAHLVEWWWIHDADFGGLLKACSSEEGKTPNQMLLYNTLWVDWEEDKISFPDKLRENRNYYTLRAGENTHWIDNPHLLWGNQLLWWSINGTSLGKVGKYLNRDATGLVAPNRLYGDPSPLNQSQDRNTVGHLVAQLGTVYPHQVGLFPMTPEILTDTNAFAPTLGAEFAYEAGLPVLYQHQLENVRVGEIAAACGKSTLVMVFPLKNGKLRKVKVSVGQFLTDKATKLFNRDSLLGRCPAIVSMERKAKAAEEGDLGELEGLASDLLS
jgi:hypothetical protein